MKTIQRYELPIGKPLVEHVTLDIPFRAEVLSVGQQDERVCMWALVETRNAPTRRRFVVASTSFGKLGPNLDGVQLGRFVGTVHLLRYSLHIFEAL